MFPIFLPNTQLNSLNYNFLVIHVLWDFPVGFNKSEQFYVAKCYAILRWNLFIEMFVWIGHIAGVNKLPAPVCRGD